MLCILKDYWKRGVFLEAFENTSSYLIAVVTLIVATLIFLWIYERVPSFKGSTSSLMSKGAETDVAAADPQSESPFGIPSKVLTQTTCGCIQCDKQRYIQNALADDRNVEESTFNNQSNVHKFWSKHSIISLMDTNKTDSSHDQETQSFKEDLHRTCKELDIRHSNDFIK